jgi:hypothetical protein
VDPNAKGQRSGCVVFSLESAPTRPRIDVRLKRKRAIVKVAAGRVGRTAVVVRVVGVVGDGRRKLATLVREADAAGTIDFSFAVPIQPKLRRLCVEAKLGDGLPSRGAACPLKIHRDTGVAYYDVAVPQRSR